MSQAQRLQGLKGPMSVSTPMSASGLSGGGAQALGKATTSGTAKASTKASTKKDSRNSVLSGLPYNTALQNQRLDKCDWSDRLLYASRMLLGGNNVNGFLRGTATAQRIKKQRARQVGINKKAASQAAGGASEAAETDKKDKRTFNQEDEEKLKKGMKYKKKVQELCRNFLAILNSANSAFTIPTKEIMNPRTVKKLKAEMEASVQFCAQLHNLLRGIIFDVDHKQNPYLPQYLDEPVVQNTGTPKLSASTKVASSVSSGLTALPSEVSKMPWAVAPNASPSQSKSNSTGARSQAPPTQSAGNADGSTLRKLRKKRMPPNTEAPANVPEFDASGRRLCTKKEHNYRIFEILRFRGLRQGDFVAARTTSRDLWILARVLQNYPAVAMAPLEFLQLSDARRDSVFRDKVLVKDVEEKDGNSSSQVARSLVLPLPRTYSEAADWGQRIKKGMRVYAMYPQTTSLYPATVIDSTTYCRDDDDIIIVEFDGEELDAKGLMPKYHIPARFVTLIPRELPAAQPAGTTAKANKRKSTTSQPGSAKQQKNNDDFLSFDFDETFDALDLDFDKPLVDGGEDPGFSLL